MVITTGGDTYSYDGTTLTTATDPDFQSPASNTMLNNQWIYDGTGEKFWVSDAGDPLTLAALNNAEAESRGDPLSRAYAFKQWVYLFGTESIEPWYNSGVGDPPFDRIDNGIMEKGLGALHSVSHTDNFMYFYGDDDNIYQVVQTQIKNITPPYLNYQLSQLDKSAAIGNCIQLDGQDFYQISFGSKELTYCYSEQTGAWFNLSTGTTDDRYVGTDLVKVYDTIIGFDLATSNAIELDDATYTDLGAVIVRERVFPPLNSAKLDLGAGKRLIMDMAKFIMETGQGLNTGQGVKPKIMVSAAQDGARTFSTERWINFGQMGEFLINVEFWEMISFYDISFKITVSDPVFCSLHDASVRVKLDGY